jgi:predicted nucleotidyltransferase
MVDIKQIEREIVERLKPLDPKKIILFGSYAAGTADDNSDVDVFLVSDSQENTMEYQLRAMMRLKDLISKYRIGFDVLSASQAFLNGRQDYFYRVDILKNGKVLYVKQD